MKLHQLFGGTFLKGVVVGKPLKLRNTYSSSDLSDALSKKPTRQTVTIVNHSSGTVVGKRSIWQA